MTIKRPRRFRKLILWMMALGAAVVVGGAIAAYQYVTEGDTLATLIRREAPRYLRGCQLDLIQVRLRPVAGQILLHAISLKDGDSGGRASIAYLPYLQINYNPWAAFFHGRFEPTEVVVPRPTIRLRRRGDGTWNCQGLVADPWPGPTGGPMPPIRVKDGTIELVGEGAGNGTVLKVLTGVDLQIPALAHGDGPVPFELSAKGDLFERVHLKGVIEPSGRINLEPGELVRLNLSEAIWDRLPGEVNSILDQVGLAAGEVDANWSSLVIDPRNPCPVRADGAARLRRGILKCSRLPFPVSDVAVDVEIHDGQVVVTSASGSNGATALAVQGKFDLDGLAGAPFEVTAEAKGLQLDGRLREKTPPESRELWDLYFPEVAQSKEASAGRINLVLRANRPARDAEVGLAVDIDLVDVAMQYKHFPYRVEHVQGRMHLTPRRLTLDNVHTTVGNRPFRVDGTVDDPGPDAIARLHFAVEALPVDDPLFLRALPPDVQKVMAEFKPTGTVRGRADLFREPDRTAKRDPMGLVKFDAVVDLNESPGCSATWKGLEYPVRNLTGRLEIHPDLWIFTNMRGRNGQATLQVDGRVEQVRPNEFKVGVKLKAENLPFDDQLRDALPTPWRLTWKTLNPTGASDIEAIVTAEPGKKEHSRVQIRPRPQTGVTLRFNPVDAPGSAPRAPLELRMDDVSGQFLYDTALSPPTAMSGVAFTFQRAGVTFAQGTVDVKDTGEFQLGVSRLEVTDLLLDDGLRRMMPPVMATFARRLDDKKLSKLRANLGLGWSGKSGESAWCAWDNGLVLLIDNKLILGGQDVALEHIQGQLDNLKGSFDGKDLKLFGDIALDSVSVLHQQLTRIAAKMSIKDGQAGIDLNGGGILGGTMAGRVSSTLDATPRYSIGLAVEGADLQDYAKNLTGHQTFKGRVSGRAEVNGLGYDLHSLTGSGYAKVVDGDFGTLPLFLRLWKVLKLTEITKTAFDSAEVTARIINGETTLKPVHLIGNAVSLQGDGTLDIRGVLNLKLELLSGRDSYHIPILSDVTRELSGLIGVIQVEGPIAAPSFRVVPLPPVAAQVRHGSRLSGETRQRARRPGPERR